MQLSHFLSATVEKSFLREPDSDGDTCLEGSLTVKSDNEQLLEFFLIQQVLLGNDGRILSSSRDEREDSLGEGEELSIDLDSGYFKVSSIGDSSKAKIDIDVFGCKADYSQLPSVHLGDGLKGLYGWNQLIYLGTDVTVESLAVGVKPADDDGDVCVAIRALVCNTSSHHVPKFMLHVRAIAAGGREIDNQTTYEVIPPGERRVIEVSFYSLKANRMNGLSFAVDATSFCIQSKANANCEIELSG